MRAIVKTAKGYGNLEIREIPKPKIREDEVLIEIKATGICGSDIHHYEVGDQIAIPVVLGHEFSGEVIEIGKEVRGWKLGDRIVAETHAYACYECYVCKSGNYHLCKGRKGFGSSVNGAFTEYISVPARLLHKVPDNSSYPEASLLQPTADIIHAVLRNADVKMGDTVVVFGPGPMGLLTIEVSKIAGAGKVIVVGLNEDARRMKIAEMIGADFVINRSNENLFEKIDQLTNGRGAEVVFEVSGSRTAFLEGLKVMSKRGQMVVIGVPTQPVEIDLQAFQAAEQTIRTSIMSTWEDYERAIKLLETGRLQLKNLITDVLPMSEWKRGFDLAITKEACKVIFSPAGLQ
jgi:2-desacetyl-2-hydroxyethyl bacteriochlorophyllide A dehydrogenase